MSEEREQDGLDKLLGYFTAERATSEWQQAMAAIRQRFLTLGSVAASMDARVGELDRAHSERLMALEERSCVGCTTLRDELSDVRLRLHDVEHHPALEIPPLPNRVERRVRGPLRRSPTDEQVDGMIKHGLYHGHREALVAYMQAKIDIGDWHAVADAAVDLQVLEARGRP